MQTYSNEKNGVDFEEIYDSAKREVLEIIKDLVRLVIGTVEKITGLIEYIKELWATAMELMESWKPKQKPEVNPEWN